MSDAAITSLVSGAVTIATMAIGFLTMYVKLKYSNDQAKTAADKAELAAGQAKIVEEKIDANAKSVESKIAVNTALTEKIDEQTNGGLDKRLLQFADHASRIGALESAVDAIRIELGGVSKNIDSTRHEMRGHLQAITQSLNLINARNAVTLPLEREPSTPHG